MKVEIRKITDINNEDGELLATINVDTKNISNVCNQVGAAIIDHAKKQWGEDIKPVNDSSIFGGYVRNSRGDVIVAR